MAAEIKVKILPVILVLMHLAGALALSWSPDFNLKLYSEFFQILIFHKSEQVE